ncbi:protein rogdi homolog isoform X1 [Python bivittatus]|uniref:Protein rogdi homolog n=1 Tax=Python bivittatus TaxID=176946 RepID=A0A9F3QSQ6_PYTBI|nr:protein rogdi homolog isoform X1 [Python bivittatus]
MHFIIKSLTRPVLDSPSCCENNHQELLSREPTEPGLLDQINPAWTRIAPASYPLLVPPKLAETRCSQYLQMALKCIVHLLHCLCAGQGVVDSGVPCFAPLIHCLYFSADQVKGILTLQGDALCQADINLKMPRNNQLVHFAFRDDKQWKLQQIQDARNHVNQAVYLLTNRSANYQFKTGCEVLKLMDAVMLQLTRARNRLTTPATLSLPEIAASGLTKMFTPALPSDILVNFYINLNKLCLTVYQLHPLQPNSTKNFRPAGGSILHNPGAMFEYSNQRYEVSHVHKVECVVPWLNDALVFFTVSLQLCQQLKDKIAVFSGYWNYRLY